MRVFMKFFSRGEVERSSALVVAAWFLIFGAGEEGWEKMVFYVNYGVACCLIMF